MVFSDSNWWEDLLYFYIDESGHTGLNLFDQNQPLLYYGVLSSRMNVDILAENQLRKLRNHVGLPRLHAADLGNRGLVSIIDGIIELQQRFDIRFDLYRVAKPDHAIICFFDQVFDQGINPAMTWSGYWTPIRYILLLKIASLFDELLAKRAWEARIEIDDAKAEHGLVEVCLELCNCVGNLPDARSQQLISDTLRWAIHNPSEMNYNTKNKEDRLQVSPNIVGFQSVMHGIAARIKKHKKKESSIIVDQQSQFNKAQRTLSEFFLAVRGKPWINGPGLPTTNHSHMPTIPITFSSSTNSAGLELVDVHLWVFKRYMEKKEVARELLALIKPQIYRGLTDELSLKAIEARWSRRLEELPEPTEKEIAEAKKLLAIDEERRLQAVQGRTQLLIPED